jgi:hypothetical protein
VEFATIKVNVLYHYSSLFRLRASGWLVTNLGFMVVHLEHEMPKILIFLNMLACQVTPKNNDKTSKGQLKMLFAYITMESGLVSKDFWNIDIKVMTLKHHFIQT